jgi:hypothetical protein
MRLRLLRPTRFVNPQAHKPVQKSANKIGANYLKVVPLQLDRERWCLPRITPELSSWVFWSICINEYDNKGSLRLCHLYSVARNIQIVARKLNRGGLNRAIASPRDRLFDSRCSYRQQYDWSKAEQSQEPVDVPDLPHLRTPITPVAGL